MLKVGDRVRCTGSEYNDPIGKVGVVLQLDRETALCRFDEWHEGHGANDAEWWLCFEELVPVAEATGTDAGDEQKFKVGDRVKFRDDYNSSARGTEATVAYYEPGEYARLGVTEADHGRPDGISARFFEPVIEPTITIQAGRYYKTRDGRKVGPMENFGWRDGYPWCEESLVCGYYSDDGRVAHRSSDEDLIAEWVDEPQPANDNSTAGFTIPLFDPRKHDFGEHVAGILKEEDKPLVFEDGKFKVRAAGIKQEEPDTTLHIKFTSDFSELDAEIDRVKRRLKKLAKKARKLGINLDEAA